MNIGEFRRWGREELSRADSDSSQLDADLLLAAALGSSREHLLAHDDESVAGAQEALYRANITRRAAHEPIAYILGKKEFFGIEFNVSPEVLIPRPETEFVVEEALRVFLSLGREEELLLLDIGTGSGAILLSILNAVEELRNRSGKQLPRVSAYGSDTSEGALKVARENAENLGLAEKSIFLKASLLGEIPQQILHCGTYALILANLPYISTQAALPPDVLMFEPTSALFGGENGAEIVLECLHQLNRFRPCARGCMLLEIGHDQREVLAKQLESLPGITFDFIPDLQGIPRVAKVNYRDLCS